MPDRETSVFVFLELPMRGRSQDGPPSSAARFHRRPRVDRQIVTGGQERHRHRWPGPRNCSCLYSSARLPFRSFPLKCQQKTMHKRKTAEENRVQGDTTQEWGRREKGMPARRGKQHVQLPAGFCLSKARFPRPRTGPRTAFVRRKLPTLYWAF